MCFNKVPCPTSSGEVAYRPCGKCLDCLRQYQQDWTCRLSEEFKAWSGDSVIFFTLTYDDSMLPVQVTYNHPITLMSYSVTARNKSVPYLSRRLSRLGLDSFHFTRSLRDDTPVFRSERRVLCDSYLDIPAFERPALCVPTASYEDVNSWIRYCRKYFDRHVRSNVFRGKRVNPYLKDLSFKNVHGVDSLYPDSAYTPSFKYWITSEYGPQTLRPHYHGVMFGVSEEMFRDVFAPWWRSRFGVGSPRSIKYSVFDPAKGGAMYIAKYCSKGSFDHPLVTKSIHYPSGKEYFSKQYIHCVDWFGSYTVDEDGDVTSYPLCLPPFRLISKGIGIRFPFNQSVQKYWDVQCDEFTDFVCKDSGVRIVPSGFFMDLDLGVTTLLNCSNWKSPAARFGFKYCLSKIESSKRPRVLGSSEFFVDPSLNPFDFLQFQNVLFNKKYIRNYVYQGVSKTYSCLLPRYYRRFLVSPFSQVAFNVVARKCADDDFNRKRREIGSVRQADEKAFKIREIAFGDAVKQCISQKEIADRCGRFYSKLFVGDA